MKLIITDTHYESGCGDYPATTYLQFKNLKNGRVGVILNRTEYNGNCEQVIGEVDLNDLVLTVNALESLAKEQKKRGMKMETFQDKRDM